MEIEKKPITEKSWILIERMLGCILLIPPLLSVFLFVLSVFSNHDRGYSSNTIQLGHLGSIWSGAGDGGWTSAAPLYLGLMAIAGAILISRSAKR